MNSRPPTPLTEANPSCPARFKSPARLVPACGMLLALALPISLVAAPAAATPDTPPPAAAKADAPSGPEAKLARGMPAAEVKKIMGQPAKVQAFDAPSGKAEVWTYTRELESRSAQVQVGSKPITISQIGADNQMHTTTIAEEPIFRMQHITVVEQVDLLMFNDHFLEKKVTRGKQARFD